MNTILDFFYFNGATTWTLFGRFLTLLVGTAFVMYFVNFFWLLFYNKENEISFQFYAVKGFLYSICVVVLIMLVEWYNLISINGLQWFKWRRFPFAFHNTYLLILPELMILGILFLLFVFTRYKTLKEN